MDQQSPNRDRDGKRLGELVLDVSEQTSRLIKDEIDLAKAEVSEKVTELTRGSIAGIVGGVFAFFALILAMHGVAWLLADLVFSDKVWAGYLVEALLFVIIGAAAAYFAYNRFQKGAPPIPEQAIAEAKETRATLERASEGSEGSGSATDKQASAKSTGPSSPATESSEDGVRP